MSRTIKFRNPLLSLEFHIPLKCTVPWKCWNTVLFGVLWNFKNILLHLHWIALYLKLPSPQMQGPQQASLVQKCIVPTKMQISLNLHLTLLFDLEAHPWQAKLSAYLMEWNTNGRSGSQKLIGPRLSKITKWPLLAGLGVKGLLTQLQTYIITFYIGYNIDYM